MQLKVKNKLELPASEYEQKKPDQISPCEVLQYWLIIEVYYASVKNNQGEERGNLVPRAFPLKTGWGGKREKPCGRGWREGDTLTLIFSSWKGGLI